MTLPFLTNITFLMAVGIMLVPKALSLMVSSNGHLTRDPDYRGEWILPLLFSIFLGVWIGGRYLLSIYGDTLSYARTYDLTSVLSTDEITVDVGSEWFWGIIGNICHAAGLDVHGYFTVIALIYTLTAMWAAKKFCPTDPYLATMFVVSSLFYYNFAINGLRNGVACHMILLAMAFLMEDKRIIALIIAFLAMGIHRSTMLPIAAVIAAMTVIKEPKYAFYIWLAAIPVSLLFSSSFVSMMGSLGFDERMSQYAQGHGHQGMFTRVGFRWDFLAYSAGAVWFYYISAFKKGLRDGWYNIIATTYLLSNAFWILIITVEYSNRFAYLSWFLYPIVVAYPLCNMRAWGDSQELMAGFTLLGYYALTFILQYFVF